MDPIRCMFGPASQIAPNHWQGGFPQNPQSLRAHGFTAIVLCAEELQPDPNGGDTHLFYGITIIRAPMDDSVLTKQEAQIAIQAAKRVDDVIQAGGTVLVSCQAGRNRSGLVSALALIRRYGISGKEAADRVRACRPKALTNDSFSAFLNAIPKPVK